MDQSDRVQRSRGSEGFHKTLCDLCQRITWHRGKDCTDHSPYKPGRKRARVSDSITILASLGKVIDTTPVDHPKLVPSKGDRIIPIQSVSLGGMVHCIGCDRTVKSFGSCTGKVRKGEAKIDRSYVDQVYDPNTGDITPIQRDKVIIVNSWHKGWICPTCQADYSGSVVLDYNETQSATLQGSHESIGSPATTYRPVNQDYRLTERTYDPSKPLKVTFFEEE